LHFHGRRPRPHHELFPGGPENLPWPPRPAAMPPPLRPSWSRCLRGAGDTLLHRSGRTSSEARRRVQAATCCASDGASRVKVSRNVTRNPRTCPVTRRVAFPPLPPGWNVLHPRAHGRRLHQGHQGSCRRVRAVCRVLRPREGTPVHALGGIRARVPRPAGHHRHRKAGEDMDQQILGRHPRLWALDGCAGL
jgi:hypothetical protein